MCLLVTTMAFIKPPGHLLELLRQLKDSSQVIKYALEETDKVLTRDMEGEKNLSKYKAITNPTDCPKTGSFTVTALNTKP